MNFLVKKVANLYLNLEIPKIQDLNWFYLL